MTNFRLYGAICHTILVHHIQWYRWEFRKFLNPPNRFSGQLLKEKPALLGGLDFFSLGSRTIWQPAGVETTPGALTSIQTYR